MCVLRMLPGRIMLFAALLGLAMVSPLRGDDLDARRSLTPHRESPFYSESPPDLSSSLGSSAGLEATLAEPVPAAPDHAMHPPAVKAKTPLPDWEAPDTETSATSRSSGGISSSMWWVAGLLAVGWLASKSLKANGAIRSSPTGPLEILSRHPVGPQQQIILARLGQRVVMIGATPSGMSTLVCVSDPVEAAQLIEECRPTSNPSGPTVLDLFRSRRSTPASPVTGVSVSTGRPAPSSATVRQTGMEVTDV